MIIFYCYIKLHVRHFQYLFMLVGNFILQLNLAETNLQDFKAKSRAKSKANTGKCMSGLGLQDSLCRV